jgi:hypothetical protein
LLDFYLLFINRLSFLHAGTCLKKNVFYSQNSLQLLHTYLF